LKITNHDIDELKLLQPELTVTGNTISGCFYLSASLKSKSKGRGKKVASHQWNVQGTNNPKHINDRFYIDITLDENLYPNTVIDLSGKLLSWKDSILPELWHINSDNTLCLGIESDIKKKYQNSTSFANFINEVLTEYFYYMCYVKQFGNEPWEAYRHGLFAALEKASEGIDKNGSAFITNILTTDGGIWGAKKEWGKLLEKTKVSKLKHNSNCPFCQKPTLVKGCKFHKKQIKGYNQILQYLSNTST
jgi:hypothetical protein